MHKKYAKIIIIFEEKQILSYWWHSMDAYKIKRV